MGKSKGLGDSIEKFTKVTGIKRVVDTISKSTGKPCGCDKRKKTLNKLWAYKGSLSEDDFKYLEYFFDNYNGKSLKNEQERNMLLEISNRVFDKKEKPTSCAPCLKELIQNLKIEYEKYL